MDALAKLVTGWIEAADAADVRVQNASHLSEMARAAFLHQATAMRVCAEELRTALFTLGVGV